jgi:hypothetical protein
MAQRTDLSIAAVSACLVFVNVFFKPETAAGVILGVDEVGGMLVRSTRSKYMDMIESILLLIAYPALDC